MASIAHSPLSLLLTVPALLLVTLLVLVKRVVVTVLDGPARLAHALGMRGASVAHRAGPNSDGYALQPSEAAMVVAPGVVRTPEARFTGLPGFDFPVRYLSMSGLRVAYIDTGPGTGVQSTAQGGGVGGTSRGEVKPQRGGGGAATAAETVVCLHGEPTWSYLYRHMIPVLSGAGHRVIAPDMVGFGRSDKYVDVGEYSHELHMSSVLTLFVELDLRGVTLVVQDWGGLTGLTVLPRIRGRVSRLVIMNTGLPPEPLPRATTSFNFLLWRQFCALVGRSLPVSSVVRSSRMSEAEVAAYDAPFPSAAFKAGVAAWPLMVPLGVPSDAPVALRLLAALTPLLVNTGPMPFASMAAGRAFLRTWTKPVLLAFSDGCPVTRGLEASFAAWMPHARVAEVAGAGHFLQEDRGAYIAGLVNAFINTEGEGEGGAAPAVAAK